MLRKREVIFIVLVSIFCFSTTWASDGERIQRARSVPARVSENHQAVDPYENTSVLVEAFMVRVSIEALAEAGVNPIGQSPEGISILKILSCLDDAEKAEVISGSKVTTGHKHEAQISNKETFYIKRESVNVSMGKQGPIESKSVKFDNYSSGKRFNVLPRIEPEGKIRLEASYSDSGIIENKDETIPPTQLNYDWSGIIVLQSGIPMIAGATQNDDATTFLILTATIQGEVKMSNSKDDVFLAP